MKITDFVPLSTAVVPAYNRIPKDHMSWDELLECAYFAYESLMIAQLYDYQITLIDVENYSGRLPKGLKYIDQMFYKDATADETIEDIKTIVMTADTSLISYNTLKFSTDTTLIWQPLRLSPSNWASSVITPNSPSINCQSEHTYSVRKNRCLITSFETGVIAVCGMYYPECDGEILIANHRDVINAITAYLFAEYFQVKELLGIQGSSGDEMKYRQRWEILSAKCRGNLMLNGIDQLENYRTQSQRLGQHNETYNNAFSNLSTAENIRFK